MAIDCVVFGMDYIIWDIILIDFESLQIAIVQFSDVIGFDENQLFTDDDQLPTIDLIENMVKWDDDG